MHKLKIDKLVEGGQGIGHKDDQTFFVWNALPGEEVEVEILNKRKGIYEALATNIIKPSPHRIKPEEDHFLSCSPWQIMDFEYENKMKVEIAKETYKRIGKLKIENWKLEIGAISDRFGYRNKMELSFIENGSKISLAFFRRGQRNKIAINRCKLASPAINKTAKKILDWINKNKLTERNLKSLIIRSNQKGEVIAGLFLKDKIDLCGDVACYVSTKINFIF